MVISPATKPITYAPENEYNTIADDNEGAVEIDKSNIKTFDTIKSVLTKEQEKQFNINLKIGILKQLHKNHLLSDEQLKLLIDKQKI